MVPIPRVVKAILILLIPALTCGIPGLRVTHNGFDGTTRVECRSNYDLLVFVKFNGFDLTWTSSNGREYQCGLIRDGILVGRCVESDGVITCVFNTSITEGILECCAGPCDNITLLPPSQTASPGPTTTTTLEPARAPPSQTASPGPTNTTTLEPAGGGTPDVVPWLIGAVCVAACLLVAMCCFTCVLILVRRCKSQNPQRPGVEPDGRDADSKNKTAHETDPIHNTELVSPTVTRHQPRPNMSRVNPVGPDSVLHSERTDLPPVVQLFPSGDADVVADTFKDNPQTVIHVDMGEDTEDDHPPAVSSPSADSKAPSDLGTIQSHYKAIKSEYSPVDIDREPGVTRLGVALQGERSLLYKYSEEHVSITGELYACDLPTSGTDPVPLLSPNLSASEEATKSDNNGGESVVSQPSVDQQGVGSIEGSELQIIPLTNPQNPEIHYTHVNPKPKPEGLPDQPVDPIAVVNSEVKKEKLAPKSEESEQPPQTKTAPPTPPPPPTAESLLSIIHPVACKWEEFGKALEIDEDRLDDFSNEAHDQVRLHDMVHYYFSNVHVKHMWKEFVQALRKIEEYECADRIVREKKLEGILHTIVREKRLEAHPVTAHPPSANGDPPTVVPTEPLHVEELGSDYPAKHKPNVEAVQMLVHVHMCTSNLKMTSADKLDSAEVTVHPPNANGEPPTTVDNVPTEPIHVGSGYPAKHKPNDEAVQMPVHMTLCTTNSMSADKPDVEEQHYPIEPGGVIPASLSPLLPTPDNHM